MVDPTKMCQKHLCGEHVEIHMLLSNLRKNKSIDGYLKNGLLELSSMLNRHNALAKEMINRGYNHHSPLELDETDISQIKNHYGFGYKVNTLNSITDLSIRCSKCDWATM